MPPKKQVRGMKKGGHAGAAPKRGRPGKTKERRNRGDALQGKLARQSVPRALGASRVPYANRARGGLGAVPRGFSDGPMRSAISVGPVTSSAPSSIGTTFPRSYFGFGAAAQPLADQDPEQSLRVMGRDLFFQKITAGSAQPTAGFGSTARYYTNLAPLEISLRLANLEEMFLFYAVRHLRVFYAPATASTSTTQLALAFTTEANTVSAAIAAPTQQQVMEMESACLSSAWQPFVFEFKHEGTRLWLTSYIDDAEIYDVEYQGALVCALLNGVASTTYGQLWCEYVIDFYKPTPVLTDPTLREGPEGTPAGYVRTRSGRLRAAPSPADVLRDAAYRMPRLRGEEKKSVAPAGASADPPPAALRLPPGPSDGRPLEAYARRPIIAVPGGTPGDSAWAAAAARGPVARVDPDDEWVEPSPPVFTPANSSAPGTPGYVPAKRPSQKGS